MKLHETTRKHMKSIETPYAPVTLLSGKMGIEQVFAQTFKRSVSLAPFASARRVSLGGVDLLMLLYHPSRVIARNLPLMFLIDPGFFDREYESDSP